MSIKRIRFVCPKCGNEILSANYGSDLRVDGKPVQNDPNVETFCGNCHQKCVRHDTGGTITVPGTPRPGPPTGEIIKP